MGEPRNSYKTSSKILKEVGHSDVDRIIILKWLLMKKDVRIRAHLI
jgi:hypothetical protein